METETLPENKREFKGVWIPAEVWLCKDLGIVEKALYAEICSLDGKDGCFASNAYFAKFFGISERMVSGYISSLKDHGFICVESFNGRTRILRISEKGGGRKLLPCIEENFQADLKKTSTIYNSIEKRVEKDTPIPPQGGLLALSVEPIGSPSEPADRFEDFWKSYPKCERKIGKAKCREMWTKRNLNAYADAIIKVLAVDAKSHDWCKESGRFIPMPQTWLNRKRWEDNPSPSPKSADPSLLAGSWAVFTAADADRELEFVSWASGDRKSPPPPWSVHTDEWVQQNRENIIKGIRI